MHEGTRDSLPHPTNSEPCSGSQNLGNESSWCSSRRGRPTIDRRGCGPCGRPVHQTPLAYPTLRMACSSFLSAFSFSFFCLLSVALFEATITRVVVASHYFYTYSYSCSQKSIILHSFSSLSVISIMNRKIQTTFMASNGQLSATAFCQ